MTLTPQLDPAREEAELRAYLGDAYDHARLEDYGQLVDAELEEIGDEARLYRTSEAYLYNLTAFAMTGTKDPYRRWIPDAVAPGAAVADVGCGIGSDGLLLAEHGFQVTFADFDNPSVRYLRWRLARRGLTGEILDLDRDELALGQDLAFAFDVIEHVPDPFAFLADMERCARLVLVNFLEPEPGETALHHALDVRALVSHAARHGLRRYRRYHGRSHLVLYEPRRPRPLRAAATRLLGRARSAAS